MNRLTIGVWGLAVILGSTSWAQVTQRVSLSSGGAPANDQSFVGSITPDGRYVTFSSYATNLVSGDTNGTWDVFVRDRQSGTTDRASIDSGGIQGNGQSMGGWLSADGRFVVFASLSTNLVPGDTNATDDVFVHDRQSGRSCPRLCEI